MFCPQCGTKLPEGAAFCASCGARLQQTGPAPQPQPRPQPTPQPQPAPNRPAYGRPAPGYSNRVNDPELLAAVQKQRRASGKAALFIVPLPFIGFILYALITENMELSQAAINGVFVSAVFLAFALIAARQSSADRAWEGTVTRQWETIERVRDSDGNGGYVHRDEYRLHTEVQLTTGRRKVIHEWDGRGWRNRWFYDYVKPGDRVRYLPQFGFPYEKYDKSRDTECRCPICSRVNPIENDRCKSCGNLLLK